MIPDNILPHSLPLENSLGEIDPGDTSAFMVLQLLFR